MDFPKDPDGDALRRLAEDGNDLERSMEIDFWVGVPDEQTGEKIAERLAAEGFDVELDEDEEDGGWSLCAMLDMVPKYDALVATQQRVSEIVEPMGGSPEGWGTYGNVDDEQSIH